MQLSPPMTPLLNAVIVHFDTGNCYVRDKRERTTLLHLLVKKQAVIVGKATE